jgi:KTSC domain
VNASQQIARVEVESSSVSSVGYDAELSVLELEFRNGGVYRYFAVPASVHEALMRSESKGAFLSRQVRDAYPFVRV